MKAKSRRLLLELAPAAFALAAIAVWFLGQKDLALLAVTIGLYVAISVASFLSHRAEVRTLRALHAVRAELRSHRKKQSVKEYEILKSLNQRERELTSLDELVQTMGTQVTAIGNEVRKLRNEQRSQLVRAGDPLRLDKVRDLDRLTLRTMGGMR